MITVKFFGALRIDHDIKEVSCNEGTVTQTIEWIIRRYPNIKKHHLTHSIMMLNKTPLTKTNRLSVLLKDGDELVFLSPVAGG
jgi:molybdopterin converting factor small subunit